MSLIRKENDMSSCEKCWKDAGGRAIRYFALLEERKDNKCTPEEQAGEMATFCEGCQRETTHHFTGECMNTECSSHNEKSHKEEI